MEYTTPASTEHWNSQMEKLLHHTERLKQMTYMHEKLDHSDKGLVYGDKRFNGVEMVRGGTTVCITMMVFRCKYSCFLNI